MISGIAAGWFGHSCSDHRPRYGSRALAALVGLSLSLLCSLAPAGVCPPPPGNGNWCSAKDFTVTAALIAGPTHCTLGQTVKGVTMRVSLNSTAQENYDMGFFVGDHGGGVIDNPPDGQSCTFASLTPLEPPLNLTGGQGGYRNLDGDACGDVTKNETTYRDIVLNDVLCTDTDGDGRVDLQAMATWSSNKNEAACTNPNDPTWFFPKQASKCQVSSHLNIDMWVEPPPSIVVKKTVSPASVQLSGDPVTVDVAVENTSSATDPVVIDTLIDSVHGDLNGQGSCVTPVTIAPGEFYVCSFPASVNGAAGSSETDTVTATGRDDENEAVAASDSATVSIVASPPAAAPRVAIIKIAKPSILPEPGGDVLFTFRILNLSAEPVSIQSLQDSVYGDLLTRPDLSCSTPGLSGLLASRTAVTCSFAASVTGAPGSTHQNVISLTALGADSKQTATDQARASVRIVDVASAIQVEKFADPASLPEPGGTVRFGVNVQNISPVDTVTLTSMIDSPYGNLVGAANSSCVLPQTLAPSEIYSCAFDGTVNGNAGDQKVDVVIVTGTDDDAHAVNGIAAATVTILDVASVMDLVKTADPATITSGSSVTYNFTVRNLSTADSITINSMVDAPYGDLNGRGTCLTGTVLAPGGSYSCAFTTPVAGSAGSIVADTATVSATDNDGVTLTSNASASVSIVASPPSPLPLQVTLHKWAIPSSLPEPGGQVSFSFQIGNLSAEPVTVQSLQDSVYGNLLTRPGLSCSAGLGSPLASRMSVTCVFTAAVMGTPGAVHRNVITVTARGVNSGLTATVQGDATVLITGVPSSLMVQKTAQPVVVGAPGGRVVFAVVVTNTSLTDTVTIQRLDDNVFGNVTNITGSTCRVPQSLRPGAVYRCWFSRTLSGQTGDEHWDTLIASGVDDDGQAVADANRALVKFIAESLPSVEVMKTPNPGVVTAPGGDVSFTVSTRNAWEYPLRLDSLTDDAFGNLNGQGTCSLPQTIAAGASYTCSFTGRVNGSVGAVHVNTVTATATSILGGNIAQADGHALVSVVGQDAQAIPAMSEWMLLCTGLLIILIAGLRRRSSDGRTR